MLNIQQPILSVVRKNTSQYFYNCVGIIISKELILTAAHCMKAVPDIDDYIISSGTSEIKLTFDVTKLKGKLHPVKPGRMYRFILDFKTHPDLSIKTGANDIAIVRVNC